MAVTIDQLLGLMSGTASSSRQGANSSMSGARSARLQAEEEDRRQKALINSQGDPELRKQQQEQERIKRDSMSMPDIGVISQNMRPVDPVEQVSLLQLLPKEQQDYGTVAYRILAGGQV